MHLCQRGICYSNFMEGQIIGQGCQNADNTSVLNPVFPQERLSVRGVFSLPSAHTPGLTRSRRFGTEGAPK